MKVWDAKPEGTKVRKFDQVSRLPLFPYHHIIYGKDVKKEEISINYIRYGCVILKKCSRGTGSFSRCPFCM